MESSGACNLKGAVGREAAIVAPIIKLLWSPAKGEQVLRGEEREREKGREEKRENETRARKQRSRLPL